MRVTTVDVLRHGSVQGGAYYRGSTDDPLSEHGWQQMRAWSNYDHWTRIVSSPLCRCLAFSKEISQLKNLPLHIDSRLQEIHFGEWEGKTAAEIERNEPAAFARFYQDPLHNAPPQGETMIALAQRVSAAWQDLLTSARGETILLVTHAGVIRLLFCQLLHIPLQNTFALDVAHAGLSRFQCYHDETGDFVQLMFHNRLI